MVLSVVSYSYFLSVYLFSEVTVQMLSPYLAVLFFILLNYKCSLYILVTSSSSDVYFVNIFKQWKYKNKLYVCSLKVWSSLRELVIIVDFYCM